MSDANVHDVFQLLFVIFILLAASVAIQFLHVFQMDGWCGFLGHKPVDEDALFFEDSLCGRCGKHLP